MNYDDAPRRLRLTYKALMCHLNKNRDGDEMQNVIIILHVKYEHEAPATLNLLICTGNDSPDVQHSVTQSNNNCQA